MHFLGLLRCYCVHYRYRKNIFGKSPVIFLLYWFSHESKGSRTCGTGVVNELVLHL